MHRIVTREFPFAVVAIVCAMVVFAAAPTSAKSRRHSRQLTVCQNTEFALCAASTCTATGGTIKDNQGMSHKAVSCVCPILTGNNIADLNGGNMQGSCTSSDPTIVYSTFEYLDSFPQLINGAWQEAMAITQICLSQDSFSQCWNWQCTRAGTQNGIELADCTCPMEKTSYSFATQAGLGDPSDCAQLPVGGPLFFNPGTTDTHGGH
jgi:hypothetical protein